MALPTRTLTGTLTDVTGQPLAGYLVTFRPEGYADGVGLYSAALGTASPQSVTATTASDGTYSVALVPNALGEEATWYIAEVRARESGPVLQRWRMVVADLDGQTVEAARVEGTEAAALAQPTLAGLLADTQTARDQTVAIAAQVSDSAYAQSYATYAAALADLPNRTAGDRVLVTADETRGAEGSRPQAVYEVTADADPALAFEKELPTLGDDGRIIASQGSPSVYDAADRATADAALAAGTYPAGAQVVVAEDETQAASLGYAPRAVYTVTGSGQAASLGLFYNEAGIVASGAEAGLLREEQRALSIADEARLQALRADANTLLALASEQTESDVYSKWYADLVAESLLVVEPDGTTGPGSPVQLDADGLIAYDAGGLASERLRVVVKSLAATTRRLIFRKPDPGLAAPYEYAMPGLTTITGLPFVEVVRRTGTVIRPVAYDSGDGEADPVADGWQDVAGSNGVFTFVNCGVVRSVAEGDAVLSGRNTVDHVPLAGRSRVRVTVGGGPGTGTLRFERPGKGFLVDLALTWDTDAQTTAAAFAAEHAAAIAGTTGETGFTDLVADGPDLVFTSVNEDPPTLSVAASAGVTFAIGTAYNTGLPSPQAGPDLVDNLSRSTYGIKLSGCDAFYHTGGAFEDVWAPVFVQNTPLYQVADYEHRYSSDGGKRSSGPRREDPDAPGTFIGDANNAGGITGGDTGEGSFVADIRVYGASELWDWNGRARAPRLVRCYGEEIYEGLELSGAENVQIQGTVFRNCLTGLKIGAYPGNVASATASGCLFIYDADFPAYLDAFAVVPLVVEGNADVEARIVDPLGVCDAWAICIRADGQNVTPGVGSLSLTINAGTPRAFARDAGGTADGADHYTATGAFARGEALYLAGYDARLALDVTWTAEAAPVYHDGGGSVLVLQADNAAGTSLASGPLAIGSRFGRTAYHVSRLASGWAGSSPWEPRLLQSAIASPLQPEPIAGQAPHERPTVALAWYPDLYGRYADGDELREGIPVAGALARDPAGTGTVLTSVSTSGPYPLWYDGSGPDPENPNPEGAFFPNGAGVTYGRLDTAVFPDGAAFDWSDHRATCLVNLSRLASATLWKTLARFGGNSPYRTRARANLVRVDAPGGNAAIAPTDLPGAPAAWPNEIVAVSWWFETVPGSPDTGRLTLRVTRPNGDAATATLALATPLAAGNGALSWGDVDNGGDSNGNMAFPAFVLGHTPAEADPDLIGADEARFFAGTAGTLSRMATVTGDGDLDLASLGGGGLVLRAPGGSRYRVTVDDGGGIVTSAV